MPFSGATPFPLADRGQPIFWTINCGITRAVEIATTHHLLAHICIELVYTEPNRGATEHFYRGIAPQYLSDDFFSKLSFAVRNSLSWTGIRVIVGAVRDSLESGLFDKRTDRHVMAVTYELDGLGWKEAKELYDNTLKELLMIGTRAQGRIAEHKQRGGRGLRATFVQLAFESPSGSPKGHELGEVTKA